MLKVPTSMLIVLVVYDCTSSFLSSLIIKIFFRIFLAASSAMHFTAVCWLIDCLYQLSVANSSVRTSGNALGCFAILYGF